VNGCGDAKEPAAHNTHLQFGYQGIGVLNLGHSRHAPLATEGQLGTLGGHQAHVVVDQRQIRLWCDVDTAS
jgi:hypothetical protein